MLPRAFREAVYALETNEDVVTLVTVHKEAWNNDLRFSTHREERFSDDPLREGTTHDGAEYEYRAIAVARPDDADDALPSVALVVENTEQDLGYLADEDMAGVTVSMALVLRTDPETIIEELPDFQVVNITLTEDTIVLEVSLEPIEQEASPSRLFGPRYFPGMFR